MNFIAMDFETANYEAHSACALGLIFVKNNQILGHYYSLIRPETHFAPSHIQVHGIFPKDVINSPEFPQVWEQIRPYFDSWPLVVAHNMPFDRSVLKGSLTYYGLEMPKMMTLDTVQTSRHFLKKGLVRNHRLNTLATYYNIPLNHHDALDDARACAKILIHQNQEYGDEAIKPFITGLKAKERYLKSKIAQETAIPFEL